MRVCLFYVAAALMSVYARCAQILYLTEENSGFFQNESRSLAVALSVFIVLAVAASAAVAFFDNRTPKRCEKNDALSVLSSVLLALAFLYEFLFMKYVTDSTLFVVLTNIFALLSAVSLLLLPLRTRFGGFSKYFALLYAAPLLFFLFKLICVFTVYSTVSVIAANVFYLAFLSAALVFFLYIAKLENGIEVKPAALLPLGIICSISAFCCFVPQLIAFALSKPTLVHANPHGLFLSAAVALYSTVYSFRMFKK